MSMMRLNDLLPAKEKIANLAFSCKDSDVLPSNSEFIILESYCSNLSCHCKNVIVEIVKINQNEKVTKKPLAIISYDWSSKKTRCYPTLHEQSPKTEIASYLLEIYKEIVHTSKYLERIKSHYTLVKTLAAKTIVDKNEPTKKLGRNDFCPCGSGKKYKKCCLVEPIKKNMVI